MEYVREDEGREGLCEFGRRMYVRGMVAGNEGNISCRVGENEVLITPAVESKGYMTPGMMTKIDLEGKVLAPAPGYRPSSEYRMHLGIFRENPATRAVFHSHSLVSTAFACSDEQIDTSFLPEALDLFGPAIGKTKYAMPGTDELSASVRPFARKARAVLLENHGVLVWGKSLKDAYFTLEVLENYCRFHLVATRFVGQVKPIPDEQSVQALLKKFTDGIA